jgi:hypothetical protein
MQAHNAGGHSVSLQWTGFGCGSWDDIAFRYRWDTRTQIVFFTSIHVLHWRITRQLKNQYLGPAMQARALSSSG